MFSRLKKISLVFSFLSVTVLSGDPSRAQTRPIQKKAQSGPKAPSLNGEMKAANEAASEILKERMRRDRPQDFAILKRVKDAQIIVVRGVHDHVETVLSAVQVPHLVVNPEDLDRVELNAGQLLLINCPGNISNTAIEKVRKFVNAGGFLFTTDWSLLNVLEKAFPGYVAYNQRSTSDDVVAVRVLKSDHTLLRHVSHANESPKWWLEGSSYPIRVLNKQKVEILMESDEMKRKYGEAPVAVHFKYGDGQVLHIVSHYYLQRTENRTNAEMAEGSSFSKSLGVNAPAAEPALRNTTAGAVRDAYSAQQLGANVIVSKQKQNEELEKVYGYRVEIPGSLRGRGEESAGKVADLKKDLPLKILEKNGSWWKVRTYNGDVGWVEEKNVKSR